MRLGSFLTVWLGVDCAVSLVLALVWIIFEGGNSAARPLIQPLTTVHVVCYVVTSVAVLCWIYQTYAAARAASPQLKGHPGWAVGWYFIPIASLWKPYGMMREAMLALRRPQGWSPLSKTPPLLPVWWSLWLVYGFVGNVMFQIARVERSHGMLQFAVVITILVQVIRAVLDLVFLFIVREMTTLQRTTAVNVFD